MECNVRMSQELVDMLDRFDEVNFRLLVLSRALKYGERGVDGELLSADDSAVYLDVCLMLLNDLRCDFSVFSDCLSSGREFNAPYVV